MKPWLYFVIVAIGMPIAAAGKKPDGRIADRAAFGNIHSYCVNMSDLPAWEALDVRNLVKEESKPKRLLTKMPWTLKADCNGSQPDAVVTVKFRRINIISAQRGAQPDIRDPDRRIFDITADLQVSDGESSQLLYEVEAGPVNYSSGSIGTPTQEPGHILRRDAAYHAFWALSEDIKRTNSHP